MDDLTIIDATRTWIKRVVIGLNLCPFARSVFDDDRIRYVVSHATTETALIEALTHELVVLSEANSDQIDTTVLIHPSVLTDFYAYNDFLDVVDQVILDAGLDGVIQAASFHPQYRFAESPANDVANYTNRSPFPMIHLLRESSVSHAIDRYPGVEAIPAGNVALLRSLGIARLRRIMEGEAPPKNDERQSN